MCTIRILAQPTLTNVERVRLLMRLLLPGAYIKPITCQEYFDFVLPITDSDGLKIKKALRKQGWKVV